MLDAAISILAELLKAIIAVLLIGYFSFKIFVYGSLTTGVVSLIYLLLPSFEATRVLNSMLPKLMAIWTIYPRALWMTIEQMQVDYGGLGIVITATIGAILLPPYLAGVFAGMFTWPEIRMLGLLA